MSDRFVIKGIQERCFSNAVLSYRNRHAKYKPIIAFSLKNLLTFGLLFFAIGSVVGLVAIQYWMVIVGRIVQATGASIIPAIAMIMPVRYFSPERRGRALGTVAIGFALGLALGPIIAGVVSST